LGPADRRQAERDPISIFPAKSQVQSHPISIRGIMGITVRNQITCIANTRLVAFGGCGPTQPRTRHGSEALCRWSALSGFCNGPHPPLYGSDVRYVLLSTALALRDDSVIAAWLSFSFPEQGQRDGPRGYAQR
jgi:hypothetical protein